MQVMASLVSLVARAPARVQVKLLAAFLAIAMLLIMVGAVGLQVLRGVNERTEELIGLQRKIEAYRQVQHDTISQLYSVSSALLSSDEPTLSRTLRQLNQLSYDVDRLQFVAKDEIELLGEFRQDYDRFVEIVSHGIEAIRAGRAAEAREIETAAPLADRLDRLTSQLVNKAEADMVAGIETSRQAYENSQWIVIAFALASIMLALALGYTISWSLIGPVKQIEAQLKQVAAGDFSHRVNVVNRDELGALGSDVNTMTEELGQLYQKLHQRTEDLGESLQQQTATADVLKVISRSTFNLQMVLDTLVQSVARLCDADTVILARPRGGALYWDASYGFSKEYAEFVASNPAGVDRGTVSGRVLLEGRIVHVPDVLADPEYTYRVGGYRTILGVPLLREGSPIGVIALGRNSVRPFTDKQIELGTTFADQAVIAIENTRLFEAEQQRTRELTESLEQQTATSDVLRVISSSPTDIQPVLETIGERAEKLCDAEISVVSIVDGELINLASIHGVTEAGVEAVRRAYPAHRTDETVVARAVRNANVCHVPDVLNDFQYQQKDAARVAGFRACLGMPMVRKNHVIGAIFVARRQPGLFSDTQVQLLKTFTDQAVIAIENVRLFKETKISLEQQTATADVLKIISRSTFDLRKVLQTLLESAAQFCNADKASIIREKDGAFYATEAYGFTDEFLGYMKNVPIKAERGSASGRALIEGRVVHIPDVAADPEYTLVEGARLGDYRTVLCVPMLREGVAIGLLVLTRSEVQPFTHEQIELVTTFADQAAIAIENVRLFESVEARTRELAKSLDDLRTAQDRLVQTEKLASLGQLTAGIAHEIKNPLNFVNNFSAVSVELIDELREALGAVPLDSKLRAEIGEIADTLQGNLNKVVQHGNRADAIVKNMLLHSRQGSREHRPVDINALVDESLNLAYHGARAEKQGFNITLEKSFDPAAGEVDLFPQEITRALLNLISNGFYAATKRKAEANGGDYEPTLAAATKNLGDSVEIRIRDNGTGIPPEVKDKLFNPFFTTKPAGEGTGLGLSISHDIIVKQHGGSIEVDTQPGDFTEFRIVLPRAAASANKLGEHA